MARGLRICLIGGLLAFGLAAVQRTAPAWASSSGALICELEGESYRCGRGYTLVSSDGGVFNFGNSPCYGSLGASPPSTPVVDLSPSPGNDGYYLVDAAGQVFAFGPGAKCFGGA